VIGALLVQQEKKERGIDYEIKVSFGGAIRSPRDGHRGMWGFLI
jgi:hypothetical protein